VRHVGEKLGLVLGGQREFRRLFFEFTAGLFDFLVLAFDFLVLFGKLAGFLGQFLVGVLEFGLAGLKFGGEFLGLFEQPSVRMLASMVLSTTPMLWVNCSRNAVCVAVKGCKEASSITALVWPFEEHR
jgi:hypothetical protein